MSVKISIIIPVYNASLHIEHCISSVLAQTLTGIEVIIINDGSTDDSLSIIRKFEKQDKRVIVINSINEGISAARNKGLAIAKADYIGFADADDFAEPTMYELLYQNAKEANADLAICNVNVVAEDKTAAVRLVLENKTLDIENNRQSELVNLMRFKYDYANWNKIYSAEVVRRHHLFFSGALMMYEDLLFNLCFLQYCKKGVVVDNCLYNYRIHPASVMNKGDCNSTDEYNKLFIEFTAISNTNGWPDTLRCFQKEMRRGFYYKHLPEIITGVRFQKASMLQKIKLLVSQLKKITPDFFSYTIDEMEGVQAIKKHLLKKKRFSLFSIIGLIRNI